MSTRKRTRPATAPTRSHDRPELPYVSLALRELPSEERLLAQVTLPYFDTLPAILRMRDVVQHAAHERKGVALVGPKGSGKTMALDFILREFAECQEQRHAEDAAYRVERLVRLDGMRTRDRTGLLGLIWKAVTGEQLDVRLRHRTKPYDDLRDELIEVLFQFGVVALVIDEADKMSLEALEVVRDLVAYAEPRDAGRLVSGGYRAAGLGAVLIGAEPLAAMLAQSDELGHRWVRTARIQALDPVKVPELYAKFLPCLAAQRSLMGDQAWAELTAAECWYNKPVPVRLIENHVRAFVRMVYNTAMRKGELAGFSVATMEFDLALFKAARKQLATDESLQGL